MLLCVGRRGTPRKLDVPGEDLPKVVYRLVDATQYRGHRVLVVGGGDSAVEAALAVCAEPGTHAALSYRGASFSRIKPKNRERLERAKETGALRLLLESEVTAIEPERIVLKEPKGKRALRNYGTEAPA